MSDTPDKQDTPQPAARPAGDDRAARETRPPAPGAAPRAAALSVLESVLRNHRPLDEALAATPALDALAKRDLAFARLLVTTALRRLGQIDALIDHCLDRPLRAGAERVYDVLRLGVCQLVFLQTPPHAAVGETVALAGAAGQPRLKPLVNAVLRRLATEGAALVAPQDAARLNTPDWLWRSWSEAYGADTCRAIAEAHMREPPLDLSVQRDRAAWAAALGAVELPTGTLRCAAGGVVSRLPGYDDGAWWIQDAAAALPARLLGDVAGRSVVDLCAAPGGKTAQLAAAGARVTAVDRSPTRLRLLRDNLRRLRLSAEVVAADGAMWRPAEPVDAVLVDAPCSGTGTIRRHPDIPWLKSPSHVARMMELQDRLLAAAAAMLKPGGTLVYCTCSLEPQECEARIGALLEGGAPLRRDPVDPGELPGPAELVSPDGDLRTLPCHLADLGGMDGFYAARLRRLD